jgi:hypothetical protein
MLEKRIIRVNGVDVEVDTARLEIRDIDDAQRRSAAEMAFWASVVGAAERERDEADAYYRQWKARFKVQLLESDKTLADHKLTARIEATDEFYKLKQAIARATDNYTTASGMYGAWEKRVNLAQSLGARERGEREAIPKGTTRERPVGADGDEVDSEGDGDDSSPRPTARIVGDTGDKKKRLKNILGKSGKD